LENHDSIAGLIMIAIGALLLIAIVFASTSASAFLYLAALIACIFFGVTFVALGSLRLRRATLPSQPKASQPTSVSALAQVVLQMVSEGGGQEEIAKKTGVSPSVVAEKWVALTSGGYLADGHLTEKGFETLRNAKAKPV